MNWRDAMSTAVVVTSGKGGTGKTSLTGGVSSCLAALGRRVLCIDMDIGLRNLDISLGLTDRALMDFTDVLEGRCSLKRAAVPHPVIKNLYLLTAPLTLPPGISEERMKAFLRKAREQYDYILMDSPAGMGEGFRLAVCGADRGIVVSTTDASALRDAQRVVSQLSRQLPSIHLVVNRVQPKLLRRLHTTIDDAMDAAGLPLLGVVPEDEQVMLSANQGKPIILASRKGAAVAYLNIARRLMGERVPLMHIR
ncbi:septum site-determining protein MinD [Pseudoflavonifractor capillosus ATCC 29799]|uniref:Septum site-determining protein MinD n=2 Tax=Pseudoflavonifractor capillosus TaxID=106588 RepID=A6NQB5_9FIRM|nr:septum site-determining protein MinD [Pseudoflavonifractor capillosus ATCC 29799]